jgi:hypothetical protein
MSKLATMVSEKDSRQAERERQREADRFLTQSARDIDRIAGQLRTIFLREINRSSEDLHRNISREAERSIARLQNEVERVVDRNVARLRAEINQQASELQAAGARRLVRESQRLAESITSHAERALERTLLRMETDLQRETLRSDTDLQMGLSRESERLLERFVARATARAQAAADLIRNGLSSFSQESTNLTTHLSDESASSTSTFTQEADLQIETETQEAINDVMQASASAEQIGTVVHDAARSQIADLRQASRKLDRKVARRAMRAQALANASDNALTTQFDQVFSGDVSLSNAQFGAIMNNAHYLALSSQLSLFTVSGASKLYHDGFKVQSNGVDSEGFGFDASSYGLTVGARWDASRYFGVKDEHFIIGLLGNYTRTSINIDSDPELHATGEQQAGEGEVDTVSGGVYSIFKVGSSPF